MRRSITLGLGCCLLASPLYAALKQGAQAPAFTTPAAPTVHCITVEALVAGSGS